MIKFIKRKEILLLFIGAVFFLVGILLGVYGMSNINEIRPNESSSAFDIFKNNFRVGLIIFFSGIISCGIIGDVVLLLNGKIVGELIQYLVHKNMGHL